ncbi:MAG: four helix bundle protein [Alteraurantiacibacter sp.]|nr:four helix bundle protein [Alteraurantiacibacter sp.]
MTPEELKARTKKFALRVLKLADSLPRTVSGRTLAAQIADSGTSTASNYRAACKARSRKEFVAKLGIAEEEADETQFWLEMIMDSGLIPAKRLQSLYQEARELTAILAASRKSASGD